MGKSLLRSGYGLVVSLKASGVSTSISIPVSKDLKDEIVSRSLKFHLQQLTSSNLRNQSTTSYDFKMEYERNELKVMADS